MNYFAETGHITVWRPRAPANYVVLGDCVTSRYTYLFFFIYTLLLYSNNLLELTFLIIPSEIFVGSFQLGQTSKSHQQNVMKYRLRWSFS